MRTIVIIGNGIAGITAACEIRKRSSDRIIIISAETQHFFSRTALMYVYMGHMKYEHIKPYEDWFWQENNLELLQDYVTTIQTDAQQLHLQSGNTVHYDVLIIATGSQSNKFGWPGQDLHGVQGLYSWQDLQLMEYNTRNIQHAVIVGGGLIGVEAAEMLSSRHISLSFLVRESSYWSTVLPLEESALITRHIRSHGIDIRLGTELESILPDKDHHVRAIRTTSGEEIPCEFVLLAVGVRPNITTAKSAVACNRGIMVNEYFETNIPQVYAIGDCAEITFLESGTTKLEPLWYAGRAHGATVAQTICGMRTPYNPGVFFNSAKFFDIEYQTYGKVGTMPAPEEKTLYWEHPDGSKSLRIVYTDTAITGFNVLGIRYRQAVCEHWIRERCPVEYVLEHLGEANFDPEFFAQYESEILAQYTRQHPGKKIVLQRKRGLSKKLLEMMDKKKHYDIAR